MEKFKVKVTYLKNGTSVTEIVTITATDNYDAGNRAARLFTHVRHTEVIEPC